MDDRGINLVATLGTALGDAVAAAVESATGLSGAAPAGLATLLAEPGLSVDAFSRTVGVTGSGGVRLADRLTASGLVERRPGRDARSVTLWLTAAGEQLARRALTSRHDVVQQMTAALDADAQATLVRLAEIVFTSVTGNRAQAERLCRLCDVEACPPPGCPVEQAVR